MEQAITTILVSGAVLFLARKAIGLIRGKAKGCGHCGQASACGADSKDDSCATIQTGFSV